MVMMMMMMMMAMAMSVVVVFSFMGVCVQLVGWVVGLLPPPPHPSLPGGVSKKIKMKKRVVGVTVA